MVTTIQGNTIYPSTTTNGLTLSGCTVSNTTGPGIVINPKPDDLSMEDRIAKERRDQRNRERVEAWFESYDELGLDETADGTIVEWQDDDERWHSAVHDDEVWRSDVGLFCETDQLILHLIKHEVPTVQLRVLQEDAA